MLPRQGHSGSEAAAQHDPGLAAARFSYFRVWGVRMTSRMAEYREKSRRRKEMLKVTSGGVVI